MIRKSLVTIAAAIAAAVPCLAQGNNLNPTIQVTNSYKGSLTDADKAVQKVSVPDSLYRFDLDFNYGGFEIPYKGIVYFNPYYTTLKFSHGAPEHRKIYLKAGAGYTFAPEVDGRFVLKGDGDFKVSACLSSNSFAGEYFNGLSGYESRNMAGLDLRYDWENYTLLSKLRYDGIFAAATSGEWAGMPGRSFNGAGVDLSLISKTRSERNHWVYRADLGYDYARDMRGAVVSEHNVRADVTCGYLFSKGSSLEVMASADVTSASRDDASSYSGFAAVVNPRYYFNSQKVSIGVGGAILFSGGKNVDTRRSFFVWPTVNFKWIAIPDKMDFYARAGARGGVFGARENAHSYAFSLNDDNLAVSKVYTIDAGMRGTVFKSVYYTLGAGLEKNDLAPLIEVGTGLPLYPGGILPKVVHVSYDDFMLAASVKSVWGGFSLEAKAEYRFFFYAYDHPVLPSALRADVQAGYNLSGRVTAYVGSEFRSAYKAGESYTVPFWANLRAGGQLRITDSLAVFLQGRNLLGASVQEIPGISRKGICIIGGIVLTI